MKSNSLIFFTILLFSLNSCGVPQEEYDDLKSNFEKLTLENSNLKSIIDELENGEERLIALIEKNYKEKKYAEAIQDINKLKETHPESDKINEFESLLVTINIEVEKEKKRVEEEEKEKFRIANLDNTGMWENSFFVDDFGNATKDGFIVNKSIIKGVFSNSATTDSDLNINILIPSSNRISIMLYEYAGNNPVKSYGSTEYSVLVLDNQGKQLNLSGTNYSDRLVLDNSSSSKLNSSLIKGGRIQFNIKEKGNSINKYEFVIANADFYENALRKLKEK